MLFLLLLHCTTLTTNSLGAELFGYGIEHGDQVSYQDEYKLSLWYFKIHKIKLHNKSWRFLMNS